MKVIVNTKVLLPLINAVAKIGNTKSLHTFVQCLLCKTFDGCILLTAVNDTEFAQVRVPAVVIESGTCCFFYGKLIALLKGLGGEDITISDDDKVLRVEYGSGYAESGLFDVSDFPSTPPALRPNDDGVSTVIVPAKDFVSAVDFTYKSINSQSIRETMTCVHMMFSCAGNNVKMEASDGKEIGQAMCSCVSVSGDCDILFPYYACVICVGVGKSATGNMEIRTNNNIIDILFNGIFRYRAPLKTGRFPNVASILDSLTPVAVCTIVRKTLSNALTQVAPFVDEVIPATALAFRGNALEVSAAYVEEADNDKAATVTLQTNTDGEETRECFNIFKLSNIIKRFKSDNCTVSIKKNGSAPTVYIEGGNEIALLMAMAV